MKVILLQDVAKIGKRTDMVEVSNGYALNQLIPKGMAEAATQANKKRLEKQQKEAAANQAADEARFTAAQTALTDRTIEIAVGANELGHTFKAVNEQDIAEAAKAAGVDVEASMIVLRNPIKDVGTHVALLVRGDSEAEFSVNVVKQEDK